MAKKNHKVTLKMMSFNELIDLLKQELIIEYGIGGKPKFDPELIMKELKDRFSQACENKITNIKNQTINM